MGEIFDRLRALGERIRREALEEAAKIAEAEEGYPTLVSGECGCGESIAKKIRART